MIKNRAIDICKHSKNLIIDFIKSITAFAGRIEETYPQNYNHYKITLDDFKFAYTDINTMQTMIRVCASNDKIINYIRTAAFRIYVLSQRFNKLTNDENLKCRSLDWQMLLLIATTYDLNEDGQEEFATYVMSEYDAPDDTYDLNDIHYNIRNEEIINILSEWGEKK